MSTIPMSTRYAEVLGNTPILRRAGRWENRLFLPHGGAGGRPCPEFLAFPRGCPVPTLTARPCPRWVPRPAPRVGLTTYGNCGNAQSFHYTSPMVAS